MSIERIQTGQNQPPAQLPSTKPKDGEQAFHDLAKSKGNTKEEIDQATSERTRLTRTKRAGKTKKNNTSLFVLSNEEDLQEEATYRTVMVDGILFTLRFLAVA